MPDYWVIHHFCDSGEITEIVDLFGEVVYRETIPIVKKDGVIVQACGIHFILKRAAEGRS
jgi:hypothetical protein